MWPLPDILTHNYHPDRGAFRNVCTLPPAEAERVLDRIRATGAARLRPGYLGKRLAVEDWLIAERTAKLGPTPLARPIYFFLGDYADGKDPSRPCSIVLPLAAFSPGQLTFTYPDSMASLPLARKAEHVADRKPHHGKVFTLDEIRQVVAETGLPNRSSRHDRFIEVQVWDDAPLADYGPAR